MATEELTAKEISTLGRAAGRVFVEVWIKEKLEEFIEAYDPLFDDPNYAYNFANSVHTKIMQLTVGK